MLMLKTFPDTRFAYAFFVIFAVLENWATIQSLIESDEYKLFKRTAKPGRRELLKKFEKLVGDSETKRKGVAAVGVMRPVSTALHYLEGDDVDASHVLPIYTVLHQNAQFPSADIKDELDQTTLDAVTQSYVDRWLGCKGGARGAGAKVGIMHDAHCLAWKLDLHARFMVKMALGEDMLVAMDACIPDDAIQNALKTYSRGNRGVEAALVSEYESFTAKAGSYALKWRAAELVVERKLPAVVANLAAAHKDNPVSKLVELFKNGKQCLIARTMHQSMSQEPSASHDQKLFTTMAVDVLSIVMHACAVERINKGHGFVHSKARASLGNETTQDCLYIFTNESLLYKKNDTACRPWLL